MATLTDAEIRSRLRALSALSLQSASEIAVMSVANLQDDGGVKSTLDRQTEYFSESELDEIIRGFRQCGFYCDTFIGEDAFMRWVLGGGPKRFPRRHLFVYNTAQTGGGAGRKSLIPSFCALHGIRTLNSNAYAVSLARHKFHVNAILRAAGTPVPMTWWYLGSGDWLNDVAPTPDRRVLCKPTFESASIGITAQSVGLVGPQFLARLDDLIAQLGQPLVVQEFVSGREAETPIVVDGFPIALPSVGISIDGQRELGDDFLVYEKVAVDNFGFYRLEEDDPHLVARLGEAASSAARTLQLEGFCRVDARIGDNGDIRITDVSTTPHLVAHSSFAFRFKDYAEDASIYASLAGLALKAQLSVQN